MMPVNRQSPHNRPYPGAAYRWPDGRDTARSGNYLEEVTIMATTVTQRVWIRAPGRADAEDAVKRIAGVTTVVNQIEEPPESPSDTQTRRDAYRSIYTENGPLFGTPSRSSQRYISLSGTDVSSFRVPSRLRRTRALPPAMRRASLA